MRRANSLEKALMLGKIEGSRRKTTEDERVGWHHQLDISLSNLWAMVKDREAWLQYMGSQRVGHDWATEQQQKVKLSGGLVPSRGSERRIYFHLFLSFFFYHLEATSILWLPLFSKYHFNPCFCHHITFSNFSFISIKESSNYVGPTCIIQDNLPISRSLTLFHMLNPFCHVRLSFTISGD